MSPKSMSGLFALVIALFVGANSIYVVSEFERAVELRLGKIVNSDVSTGLHFKVPFFDTVRKFDGRILTLDAKAERILNSDQKYMEVDSFAKWRVKDVEAYYTSTSGDQIRAERILQGLVSDAIRNQFAKLTLQEVVSGEERDALMEEVKAALNVLLSASDGLEADSELIEQIAAQGVEIKDYGIEVVDVRVKRIDLPKEVSGQVFQRMRAERQLEAAQHRADGEKEAKKIRANADKTVTVTLAEGYSESEKIRGAGDAEAAEIYAGAFQGDPEFYSFVRSLNAYKASFANKQDVMLIDPESDFFKYLKSSQGDSASAR